MTKMKSFRLDPCTLQMLFELSHREWHTYSETTIIKCAIEDAYEKVFGDGGLGVIDRERLKELMCKLNQDEIEIIRYLIRKYYTEYREVLNLPDEDTLILRVANKPGLKGFHSDACEHKDNRSHKR